MKTYEQAKFERDRLEQEVKAAGQALQAFPRNAMGLVSETIRVTPSYQAARKRSQDAQSALRAFNSYFTKAFKKEIQAERSQRFSKKPLGVTARQGPRTGYPYVPWDVSEAIADKFLEYFSDACTDNRIKPPSFRGIITGGSTVIPDAATGQPVPITVVMEPTHKAFEDIKLPIVGKFEGDRNVIRISPTIGACKPYESWRNILISAIRHELTHAADIYLYKTNRALDRFFQEQAAGKNPSLKRLPKPVRDKVIEAMTGEKRHKNLCTYVRDPVEQNAFITQVGSELEMLSKKASKLGMKYRNPVDALDNLSPTWREIGHCLTPKQKKRFQKMAATFWERGVIPRK